MLAGGGLISIMKYKRNDVKLLNITYVIIGLTFAFSGVLPRTGYFLFVVFTIIGGLAGAANHATFAAVIQKKIDPAFLGRVFSVNFSITLFPSMLGLLGTGFIADSIGITPAFIISGSVIALAGAASFFFPSLIRLGETEEADETKEVMAEV
jgi:DHA3 family macrolide efflux protein-like MFS transporter